MATDFLQSNTAFPRFTGRETTEQKVEALTDYTYMLLKQLRYTLNNLGVENWNDKELTDFSKLITDPIGIRLQDEEENLATLSLTVNGLSSSVSSLSGSYTALSQTVEGISLSAVSVEGGAVLRLQNGETNNDVSLSMAVTNNTAGYSTVSLKSGLITLATSGQITLGGEVVFLGDLAVAGATTINGSSITTGVINAVDIEGVYIRGCVIEASSYSSALRAVMQSDGFYLFHDSVSAPKITLYANSAGSNIQLILGAGDAEGDDRLFLRKVAGGAEIVYYDSLGVPHGFGFSASGTTPI